MVCKCDGCVYTRAAIQAAGVLYRLIDGDRIKVIPRAEWGDPSIFGSFLDTQEDVIK